MAILNNSNAISSGGYDINNSLRFRASASAYLNQTLSSSNRQTMTWSGWVKIGALSTDRTLFGFSNGTTTSFGQLVLTSANTLDFISYNSAVDARLTTTQVFRDPSAWYHIVAVWDTTNATSTNRLKLYINGSQVTSFSASTYPAQNYNAIWNNGYVGRIGAIAAASLGNYYDGYLAEVNFVDGQALTPSSFGETDTTTGSWKPKAYTSTYGTNGFYLKFSDIATTSGSNAGLGKDFSGNTNYWTTNNISVTAGTTYDAMLDVPTNTSATVANYCVINPLSIGSSVTITNGNLTFTNSAGTHRMIIGSMAVSSGKWYAEFTVTSLGDTYPQIGIVDVTQWSAATQTGANSRGWGYLSDGRIFNNNSAIDSGEPTYTNGDIIGVAFDLTNNKVYFSKNGTFINSADPAAGTNGYSITSGYDYAFSMSSYDTSTDPVYNLNFGQRPFSYTPPTGFVRLNTYNLPDSTIKKGNTVMDATTYTGNGTTQTITNAGAFKPDFVWIKRRNIAADHVLYDSVRTLGVALSSNLTSAEPAQTNGLLTAFNSNGFGVAVVSGDNSTNGSTQTYVGWQWQAGQGSTSSNTSGSITSTVSVNTTAGFSVATWTAPGSGSFTVGHGLGVAPKFIITKVRNTADNWLIWHTSIGSSGYLLFTTGASATNSTIYNGTPTPTLINYGSYLPSNGSTYVTYSWAEIAGFSKFGSYTGNGSTDGPMIYTGFRPAFIIIKRTDAAGRNWIMFDNKRDTKNEVLNSLEPSNSDAEYPNSTGLDFLSNGFKIRSTGPSLNTSAATYIYMAFAENPFKNANAR
jgi:hypothetical protein